MPKLDGYTVSEAARELDVSDQQVYRWLDDRILKQLSVRGHARIVAASSVLALKQRRLSEVTDAQQ